MERTVEDYIAVCEWGQSNFLIFSENVFGAFIYYSHLLPLVASVLFAGFVFLKKPKLLSSRWLMVTTLLLAFWLFSDLVLWATEKPELTFFFWSMLVLIEPMIYAGMVFFMYALVDGKDISFKQKIIIFLLLLPTVLLTPTRLALVEYDLSNCYREAIEGPLAFYGYFVEIIFSLWILIFGIKRIFLRKNSERTKVLITTLAAVLFLLSFAMSNVIGSILVDWEIGQYGIFAVPLFVAVLAFMIVRYNVFNVKLLSAQMLVAAIWLLTLAILFLQSLDAVRIIVVITLIAFSFLGYFLIRSVKSEVASRERIEKLARELEMANREQQNLIHFITHQVKGFFTKSRNIFAELMGGDYGDFPRNAETMLEEGFKSDTKAVETVQEILNASNLRSGAVEYRKEQVDLREIVQENIAKQKPVAGNKGLTIVSTVPEHSINIVGDKSLLEHVVNNLIDNAVKYTPSGAIEVSLSQDKNTVRFSVKDTGVGITEEDMKRLFVEGGRGKNSVKINVSSTGYGLFIVKNIVEKHGGKVWAESAGVGKGSEFIVELPVKNS